MGQFDRYAQVVPAAEAANDRQVVDKSAREYVRNGAPALIEAPLSAVQGVINKEHAKTEQAAAEASYSSAAEPVVQEREKKAQQRRNLETTTMRERNGEVVDTDETMRLTGPATPAPDRSVLSAIEKSTGLDRRLGQSESARLTGFALGLHPSYEARKAESERQDMLASEDEFNASEKAKGSSLRSQYGVTYDENEQGINDVMPATVSKNMAEVGIDAMSMGVLRSPHAGKGKAESEHPVADAAIRTERAEFGSDKLNKVHKIKQSAGEKAAAASDAELVSAGLAEDARERSLKGVRMPKEETPKVEKQSWDKQDLWDEEGNLKPEYDTPETGTTMRELPGVPDSPFISATHEKQYYARNKAIADVRERHDAIEEAQSGKIDSMSKQMRIAAYGTLRGARNYALAAVDKHHPVPKEGFFRAGAGVTDPEGPDASGKPVYEDSNRVKTVPTKNEKKGRQFTRQIIPTSATMDEGRSDEELQKEMDTKNKNISPNTTITELDMNTTPNQAKIKNAGQENTDVEKLVGAVQSGVKRSSMSTNTLNRGKNIAYIRGESGAAINSPVFGQSIHATHAYLLDKAGINDSDESKNLKHLEKYTGTGVGAKDRARAAFHLINNQDRYEVGKQTTYDVSDGMHDTSDGSGKSSRKEAFFIAPKSGEKVSLKNTSHPEHPGKSLTGDETAFIGFTAHPDAGGSPLLAHGDLETGDFVHNGWHPYKDKAGDTVFEHHTVPEGAVHAGEIVKGLIQKGIGPNAAIRKMARGESLDLGVQGSAFHAAPLAPINNVRGTNTSHLHAEHIKNNVIHPGCADCGEIATIASKARAASKAAEFTTLAEKLNAEGRPPLAEAPTISVTMPGEEAKTVKKTKAQRKAPRFSKTEGSFINVSTSAGAAEARKNLGNAVPSGKPAWKSDIDKARAGGHISKAEALELKVSSGSLPEDKSNFKDEE